MIIIYTLNDRYKTHKSLMAMKLMGYDIGFDTHTQEQLGLYKYVALYNSFRKNDNVIHTKISLFEL